MTYFPLRQITCFFIPLVAPCKPLLGSGDAKKTAAVGAVSRNREIGQRQNRKRSGSGGSGVSCGQAFQQLWIFTSESFPDAGLFLYL